MALNKGKRFDLMDEKEWNTEFSGFYKKTSTMESLIEVAKREFESRDLKYDDIHARMEHTKVDNVNEEFWTLTAPRIDPLISALIDSFNFHKPIAMTPDLIYGYIAKGFAQHIKKYSEDLRYLYVDHEKKKTLVYINRSFWVGNPNNPWELAFESLGKKLSKNTKGTIVQNGLKFTTTSPVAAAHRNVLAMEAMERYFDYEVWGLCGIASVTLLGDYSDWTKLYDVVHEQFRELEKFCVDNNKQHASLAWWEPHVMSMLQRFRDAHHMTGEEEIKMMKDWLSRMLRYNASSYCPANVSGWINTLFPYLKDDVKNDWFEDEKTKQVPEVFPPYHSTVPFKFIDKTGTYPMRAVIGHILVGHQVKQDPNNMLLPIGTLTTFPAWVILHMKK